MENVIDLTAADKPFTVEPALPAAEPQNVGTAEERVIEAQLSEPHTRERSTAENRASARAVMIISSVCGAAAGVILALTGAADKEALAALSERIYGSFGEIFLRRTISGGAVLLLEFLLGFFAFGDCISWVCPIAAGMGGGFFIAALKTPIFLPSELAVLITITLAGASSALFSQKLLGLASGNRAYLRGMSAAEYSVRFALMLSAIIASAIYEGIVAVNFVQ